MRWSGAGLIQHSGEDATCRGFMRTANVPPGYPPVEDFGLCHFTSTGPRARGKKDACENTNCTAIVLIGPNWLVTGAAFGSRRASVRCVHGGDETSSHPKDRARRDCGRLCDSTARQRKRNEIDR